MVKVLGRPRPPVTARRAFDSLRVRVGAILLLFILNWVVSGHTFLTYMSGPVRFEAEAARLARALVEDGAFADPFGSMPTGPSTHTPPAFPVLFAALVAVFGEGPAGSTAISVLGAIVLSTWIALLPLVAERAGLSFAAGVVGASLAVVAMLHHFPEWDANYTALTLVCLAINGNGHVLRGHTPPSLSAALVGGALWALAFHLNVATLGLFVAWSIAAARTGEGSRRTLVLALLLPLLSLVPWTTRNWVVFGQPILLRGNLGLELAVSNSECAAPGLLENLSSGCFAREHPDLNAQHAREVRALGEPAYHARRMQQAVGWIRTHPGRFTRLTLQRMALFWFPVMPTAASTWTPGVPLSRTVVIGLATAASLVALVQFGRLTLGLSGILVVFPLVYYVVQFEDRYRYPILWVSFVLAGQVAVTAVRQIRSRDCREPATRPTLGGDGDAECPTSDALAGE